MKRGAIVSWTVAFLTLLVADCCGLWKPAGLCPLQLGDSHLPRRHGSRWKVREGKSAQVTG